MANGRYGTIIVDPAKGWPAEKEYALVQSEFYTQLTADGSYTLNPTKMLNDQPDYVVFNGYANHCGQSQNPYGAGFTARTQHGDCVDGASLPDLYACL